MKLLPTSNLRLVSAFLPATAFLLQACAGSSPGGYIGRGYDRSYSSYDSLRYSSYDREGYTPATVATPPTGKARGDNGFNPLWLLGLLLVPELLAAEELTLGGAVAEGALARTAAREILYDDAVATAASRSAASRAAIRTVEETLPRAKPWPGVPSHPWPGVPNPANY